MPKKKLLILGDYFYPDTASTGQLLTELCLELQNDFDITVITSIPECMPSKYWEKKLNNEELENISLIRVRTKPFDKRNKISRILHIIEHFSLVKKAISTLDHQDIVFSISQPPILGGLLGLYAKKVLGAKFIYNIQDFNPEQAEVINYLKIKLLLNILRKIDTRTCKIADKVLIVGKDMFATLKKRDQKICDKAVCINNWIDETVIYPMDNEKVREFKEKYNLEGKFVIMYSGNIGLYYDLENIVKILGRFKDHQEIIFAFVGDGAKKGVLEDWVKKNEIYNIVFIPFQDKVDLVYSLNSADVHLVTNQKGIKGVSVPSKIYGVMAVGKYVFGILEDGSEAANLIKNADCGIFIEPGQYEEIYKALDEVINSDRVTVNEKGINGRKYLEKNLKKSDAMNKYKDLFDRM